MSSDSLVLTQSQFPSLRSRGGLSAEDEALAAAFVAQYAELEVEEGREEG